MWPCIWRGLPVGKRAYKADGQRVMDINDKDGKALKNSFSRRTVPLLGIPEDHLEDFSQARGRLLTQSKSIFQKPSLLGAGES